MSTEMATVVTSIVTALRSLLQFKIIGLVDTGDKTQDSLINTFLLALLGFAFTAFKWDTIVAKFKLWRISQTNSYILNDETIPYYTQLANVDKTKYTFIKWDRSGTDNVMFTERIAAHFTSVHSKNNIGNPLVLGVTTGKLAPSKNSDSYSAMQKAMQDGTLYPIYINKTGMVCLSKNGATSGQQGEIVIASTTSEILSSFLEMIASVKVTNNSSENRVKYIVTPGNMILGTIYADRTFNMFVSRHKPRILQTIKALKESIAGKQRLGGHATCNLGIMVYGDPGTGKTMLIKAIANEMGRDVRMIDMRTIKSKSDFDNVFNDYEKYVICIDEFDTVQDVIKQRTDSDVAEEETTTAREIKSLTARKMELLKMTTVVAPQGSEVNKGPVTQELASIDKQIASLENALTLDSMLTVLDGIKEMRGRIIVATTNYLDRIDSALMRAGRFDLKIHLGKFNNDEIRELLTAMYKDTASKDELAIIAKTKFKENTYTPVEIINHATMHDSLTSVIDILADV